MEFKDTEIKTIRVALEERKENLSQLLNSWNNYEWDNIGNIQNMFANKYSFEIIKQDKITTFKTELEDIDKMLDKIYTEC